MKYDMTVTINDPNTEKGMNSDLLFSFDVEFWCNENDYGNGYHVSIRNTTAGYELNHNVYDLRYDKDFHKAHKIAWLADWSDNYWNGENGAYKLKSITITRKENDDDE